MYDNILFPTDGSDRANAVLDHVLSIAETHDATLHVLTVADTTRDSVTNIRGNVVDTLVTEGERIVSAVEERAGDRQVETVTEVIQGGVAATITEYAERSAIDCIAMATRGRGAVARALFGSVTERVVRQASVPVLTVQPDGHVLRYPPRSILVPTDGSDCAAAALDHAIGIAAATGATLHVLSVVDVSSLGIDVHSTQQIETLEERATETVAEAKAIATEAGVESVVEEVDTGASISGSIESYVADTDVDLIVMGTHGRTGVDRYLLGSVSEKTLRTAPVPVTIVPDPEQLPD